MLSRPSDKALRIAHLSDVHFGAHDPALMRPLQETLSALAPNLVAVTGDITQRGKRREFAAAQAFFRQLDRPVALAPGNHDTPLLNLPARATRPFGRFERYFGPHDQQIFHDDGLCALTLNTARGMQWRLDWSLGAVRRRQLRHALDVLQGCQMDACRIVLCHHPLAPVSDAPFPTPTRGGKRALELLVAAGVDAVLTGHIHTHFAAPFDVGDRRTYAIGAGTTLSTRTRGEPPGLNLLEITSQEIRFTPWQWHGKFEPGETSVLPRRQRG